jgi:hypothetical protein
MKSELQGQGREGTAPLSEHRLGARPGWSLMPGQPDRSHGDQGRGRVASAWVVAMEGKRFAGTGCTWYPPGPLFRPAATLVEPASEARKGSEVSWHGIYLVVTEAASPTSGVGLPPPSLPPPLSAALVLDA